LQKKWAELLDHPLVGDTRMVGLMGAFEIVKNKSPVERFDEKQGVGSICRDKLIDNGLCMRAVGDTIVCAPPFILSHSEADEMIETTWKALDLTQQAIAE
jgi:putrescine aminotransferase